MTKAWKYVLPHGYLIGAIETYGHKVINTVFVEPEEREGFWPRWPVENPQATDWEYVENHKGKEGYVDGKPYKVLDYGPLPKGWSDTPPPPPPPTPDELEAQFSTLVTTRLNAFAAQRQYDDISSARLAALSAEFASDGQIAQAAYDNTWTAAIPLMSQVRSGELTPVQAVEQLPALTWED